ncbi:MAG: PHP domain-containing protein [Gudongella sp.]|nr:PHP domain-containing protein [Gudongella sp.]
MIVLEGDYHTHTIYSSGFRKKGPHHATGTIEDNVVVAYKKGLKTIVISDHGPGHYLYGLRLGYLEEIKDEIKRLREIYEPKGLRILLGLESNIIGVDGELDVDDKLLKELDILLMGYHYGAMPAGPRDAINLYWNTQISKLVESMSEKSKDVMTLAYIKAMQRYPIDIITHPGSKAEIHIKEVATEAIKYGTALEISSKHKELSVIALKEIKDIEVELYINSDAHQPNWVGEYEKGIQKAISSGIDLNRIVNIRVQE